MDDLASPLPPPPTAGHTATRVWLMVNANTALPRSGRASGRWTLGADSSAPYRGQRCGPRRLAPDPTAAHPPARARCAAERRIAAVRAGVDAHRGLRRLLQRGIDLHCSAVADRARRHCRTRPHPEHRSVPRLPPVRVGSGQPAASGSQAPADPCAPTDDAVIATCLSAPWGLAPMADGQSALVGERTTGRILQVAKGAEPVLVAQIDGVDASGDGGLLGIALSPSYDEDGLIYAYVTTATDNRIIRIARGDVPKAIFTGIPRAPPTTAAGSPSPPTARCMSEPATPATRHCRADPASLAGKVLRLDEFGKPAESNPPPDSAVYASGFTQVAGHVPDWTTARSPRWISGRRQDLLLPLTAGKDYAHRRRRRGPVDLDGRRRRRGRLRRSSNGVLASTSLDKQQLTGPPVGRRRHVHRFARPCCWTTGTAGC